MLIRIYITHTDHKLIKQFEIESYLSLQAPVHSAPVAPCGFLILIKSIVLPRSFIYNHFVCIYVQMLGMYFQL